MRCTFCFAWLYNDMVYQRNRDPKTGKIANSPLDTRIETYQQIIADGHELAYHSHPPAAIVEGQAVYYARPNSDCSGFDTKNLHRWRGLGADWYMDFSPGVYEFDDPADPWYGQFIWERTSESLFRIADHLGVDIRHTNGGQKPLIDLTNKYGSGINHPHCLKQIRSLMQTGFDLIAPEIMVFFSMEYNPGGDLWSDSSTGYVSYFGSDANVQIYYPDINGGHIEKRADVCQGLTFMPVQEQSQGAWMGAGKQDSRYYDAKKLGGREQLAIEAFADALEIVPRTLAESAGMDPIDTLVKLRSSHAKNDKAAGINVVGGKVEDMQGLDVIEPTKVKRQAIASGAEAAEMILKIDDIIASSKPKGGGMPAGMPPGGMPGGMPGMD